MSHNLEEPFGSLLHCSVSIFELELVDVSLSTFIEGILHVDQRFKVVMPRDVRHGPCPIFYGRKNENMCQRHTLHVWSGGETPSSGFLLAHCPAFPSTSPTGFCLYLF